MNKKERRRIEREVEREVEVVLSNFVAAGLMELVGEEYRLTDKGRAMTTDEMDAIVDALPPRDN
jgi:hypothetical protein